MDCVGTIFARASGSVGALTVAVIVWQSGTPDVWNAAHRTEGGVLDATTMYERLSVIVPTSVEAKMEGGTISILDNPTLFWFLTLVLVAISQ